MQKMTIAKIWRLVWLVPVLLTSSVILADDTAEKDDAAKKELPTPDAVIEKMITAAGGKEAMAKVTSRYAKGELEFMGQGMTATFERWNAGKNQLREVVEIAQLGTMEQGVLGEHAWAVNPFQGASLQDGAEKELSIRGSRLHPLLHVKHDYAEMKTTGRESINGKSCVVLEMTTPEKQVETWFVDEESWHRIRTTMTMESPMTGKIKVTTTESNFKEIDGLMFAHNILMDQGIQKIAVRMTEVTQNLSIPAEKFQLPASVKALVDREKAKEKAEEEKSTGEKAGAGL